MTILIQSVLTFFSIHFAQAEGLDLTTTAMARVYSLGAMTHIEAGYGKLLYGKEEKNSLLYGYVRPFAKVSTIAIVHRVETGIDLFPVPFFSIGVSQYESLRIMDTQIVNCNSFACKGWINQSRLRSQLGLGLGSFFAYGMSSYAFTSSSVPGTPFYDEDSVLIGTSDGDRVWKNDVTLAFLSNERLAFGIDFISYQMIYGKMYSELLSAFTFIKLPDKTLTVGIGNYQASTQGPGLTFYAVMQWQLIPKMGIL